MKQKLRVFYGWAKMNKIRKRPALSVIFENGRQDEDRTRRFVNKMQNTACERYQTDAEMGDAEGVTRMYTEYSTFLDDPRIGGSLNAVLESNYNADENHVPAEKRNEIKEKLEIAFRLQHKDYSYKGPAHARCDTNETDWNKIIWG